MYYFTGYIFKSVHELQIIVEAVPSNFWKARIAQDKEANDFVCQVVDNYVPHLNIPISFKICLDLYLSYYSIFITEHS